MNLRIFRIPVHDLWRRNCRSQDSDSSGNRSSRPGSDPHAPSRSSSSRFWSPGMSNPCVLRYREPLVAQTTSKVLASRPQIWNTPVAGSLLSWIGDFHHQGPVHRPESCFCFSALLCGLTPFRGGGPAADLHPCCGILAPPRGEPTSLGPNTRTLISLRTAALVAPRPFSLDTLHLIYRSRRLRTNSITRSRQQLRTSRRRSARQRCAVAGDVPASTVLPWIRRDPF